MKPVPKITAQKPAVYQEQCQVIADYLKGYGKIKDDAGNPIEITVDFVRGRMTSSGTVMIFPEVRSREYYFVDIRTIFANTPLVKTKDSDPI